MSHAYSEDPLVERPSIRRFSATRILFESLPEQCRKCMFLLYFLFE